MSGPKRNADKLNTIGIVVVGICGAVLVFVTIVALQAFYVSDTSELQTMADYGGQDTASKSLRADQLNKISEYGTNPKPAAPKEGEAAKPQTFRIPVDVAMKLVVEGAKTDPSALVPTVGRADKSTVLPIFGRPKAVDAAPAAPAAPAAGEAAGSAAAPAATPAAGAGSAAAPAAPQAPTGAGTAPAPAAGAGALDKPSTPGTPVNPAGATPSAAPETKPAAPVAGSAAGAPAKGNGK